MKKLKMHLTALLIFGFSLGLFPDDVDSSSGVVGKVGVYSETIFDVRDDKNVSSTHSGMDYPEDMLTTSSNFITSTHALVRKPTQKPLAKHSSEAVVSTFIPTIREIRKSTVKDPPTPTQMNDKLQILNPIPPNTTLEPKTTPKSFSSKVIAPSSKFSMHDLSSKEAIERRVTPVLSLLNNTNSSFDQHFTNDKVVSLSDNKSISVEEDVTSPTEFEKYSKMFTLSKNYIPFEMNNSQTYPMTIFPKMTTPFYGKRLSGNLNNITNATIDGSESSRNNEVNKIKELSMNVTIPKNQKEENLNTSLSKRQYKSASIDNHQQGANFFPSSVTPPYSSLNISSELPDFYNPPIHDIPTNASENETSSNVDFKIKSIVATETTSTTIANLQILNKNWTDLSDVDLIVIEDRPVVIKKDKEYTVVLPRICTNDSTANRFIDLLNSYPNSKRTSNFSCDDLKDMKLSVKSSELFAKINDFFKAEVKTDDMIFIKIHPNATVEFEINYFPSYDGVYISQTVIIIFANVMAVILFTVVCFALTKAKCCKRKHSTSLDLRHIPHLNLKADYNLTPIPRPSISYPDSTREFLHAYGEDTYSRSRQDGTQNKRNYPIAMAKTYEDVEREIESKQEMQTFTMSSGRRSEFGATASQDYVSPRSWDRQQEKKYSNKYGVDNPGYKKW